MEIEGKSWINVESGNVLLSTKLLYDSASHNTLSHREFDHDLYKLYKDFSNN